MARCPSRRRANAPVRRPRAARAPRTAALREAGAAPALRSRRLSASSTGTAQIDRSESAVLAQFDVAGAGQLEHRRESRGQRRAPDHAAPQLLREKHGQLAPIRYTADELRQPLKRLVE